MSERAEPGERGGIFGVRPVVGRRARLSDDLERLQVRLEAEIAKAEARLRERIETLATPAAAPGNVDETLAAVRDELASLRSAIQTARPADDRAGGSEVLGGIDAGTVDVLREEVNTLTTLVASMRDEAAALHEAVVGQAAESAAARVVESASALAGPAVEVDLSGIELLREEVSGLRASIDAVADAVATRGEVGALRESLESIEALVAAPVDPPGLGAVLDAVSAIREEQAASPAPEPKEEVDDVSAEALAALVAVRVTESVAEAVAASGSDETDRERAIQATLDRLSGVLGDGIERLARQAELLRTDLVAERKARTLLEGDLAGIQERLDTLTGIVEQALAAAAEAPAPATPPEPDPDLAAAAGTITPEWADDEAPAPGEHPPPAAADPGDAPSTDDLSRIKGIGPKLRAVLESVGVTSTRDLAGRSPTALKKAIDDTHGRIPGLSVKQIERWVSEAKTARSS